MLPVLKVAGKLYNHDCLKFPATSRCAQMLVFDRKEPIQKFLDTCRGKLHIKKKAKGAAFLEGVEVWKGCSRVATKRLKAMLVLRIASFIEPVE